MNKNSFIIAAIAVLAALLATGAAMSSEIAYASGNHYSKSVRQTIAQDNYCGGGTMPLDIYCQNLGSQIKGDHNAVNAIGIQPSGSSGVKHGDDHKNDGGSYDNKGGNQQGTAKQQGTGNQQGSGNQQ